MKHQQHCANAEGEQSTWDRPRQTSWLFHIPLWLFLLPPAVYFPHSQSPYCWPLLPSSHVLGTPDQLLNALHLSWTPFQVKSLSPFFIISKGWISCGAGSVETQDPFHNIRNTFSKQSGVKREGERQWDTRVPHWRQLSLRKSLDKYRSTTTWQKWNKNKTKKVFLFCFDAAI